MNQKQQRRYFQILKKRGGYRIDESALEKDYRISVFFSELRKLSDNKLSVLTGLVFKGGTLLTKNYLGYHRISEDIDFTHQESNEIRKIRSTKKREKRIKEHVKDLLDEISLVAKACKLDFVHDRNNSRYVKMRNSRAVYVLYLYYTSVVTNQENMIKIEINFMEEMQYEPEKQAINNLPDILGVTKEVSLLGYDLNNAIMKCYSWQELIIEKLRALLTRPQPKERDIFDLFLMHKKWDVFSLPVESILRKVEAAKSIVPESKENALENCMKLDRGSFAPQEDVEYLSLIKIDTAQYEKFRISLVNHLKDIFNQI